MDDFDIYADLPSFNTDENVNENKTDNGNKSTKKSKQDPTHNELKDEIGKLRIENEKLKRDLRVELKNYSSILLTAKAEISRKDRTIADLRSKLDNLTFRRSQRKPNNQSNNQDVEYSCPPKSMEVPYRTGTNQPVFNHQFNHPPPLIHAPITFGQDQQLIVDSSMFAYPPPPITIPLVYEENDHQLVTNDNFNENKVNQTDIPVRKVDLKKYLNNSDDSEDEITKKNHYVSTIYGERLRKKLKEEKKKEKLNKKDEAANLKNTEIEVKPGEKLQTKKDSGDEKEVGSVENKEIELKSNDNLEIGESSKEKKVAKNVQNEIEIKTEKQSQADNDSMEILAKSIQYEDIKLEPDKKLYTRKDNVSKNLENGEKLIQSLKDVEKKKSDKKQNIEKRTVNINIKEQPKTSIPNGTEHGKRSEDAIEKERCNEGIKAESECKKEMEQQDEDGEWRMQNKEEVISKEAEELIIKQEGEIKFEQIRIKESEMETERRRKENLEVQREKELARRAEELRVQKEQDSRNRREREKDRIEVEEFRMKREREKDRIEVEEFKMKREREREERRREELRIKQEKEFEKRDMENLKSRIGREPEERRREGSRIQQEKEFQRRETEDLKNRKEREREDRRNDHVRIKQEKELEWEKSNNLKIKREKEIEDNRKVESKVVDEKEIQRRKAVELMRIEREKEIEKRRRDDEVKMKRQKEVEERRKQISRMKKQRYTEKEEQKSLKYLTEKENEIKRELEALIKVDNKENLTLPNKSIQFVEKNLNSNRYCTLDIMRDSTDSPTNEELSDKSKHCDRRDRSYSGDKHFSHRHSRLDKYVESGKYKRYKSLHGNKSSHRTRSNSGHRFKEERQCKYLKNYHSPRKDDKDRRHRSHDRHKRHKDEVKTSKRKRRTRSEEESPHKFKRCRKNVEPNQLIIPKSNERKMIKTENVEMVIKSNETENVEIFKSNKNINKIEPVEKSIKQISPKQERLDDLEDGEIYDSDESMETEESTNNLLSRKLLDDREKDSGISVTDEDHLSRKGDISPEEYKGDLDLGEIEQCNQVITEVKISNSENEINKLTDAPVESSKTEDEYNEPMEIIEQIPDNNQQIQEKKNKNVEDDIQVDVKMCNSDENVSQFVDKSLEPTANNSTEQKQVKKEKSLNILEKLTPNNSVEQIRENSGKIDTNEPPREEKLQSKRKSSENFNSSENISIEQNRITSKKISTIESPRIIRMENKVNSGTVQIERHEELEISENEKVNKSPSTRNLSNSISMHQEHENTKDKKTIKSPKIIIMKNRRKTRECISAKLNESRDENTKILDSNIPVEQTISQNFETITYTMKDPNEGLFIEQRQENSEEISKSSKLIEIENKRKQEERISIRTGISNDVKTGIPETDVSKKQNSLNNANPLKSPRMMVVENRILSIEIPNTKSENLSIGVPESSIFGNSNIIESSIPEKLEDMSTEQTQENVNIAKSPKIMLVKNRRKSIENPSLRKNNSTEENMKILEKEISIRSEISLNMNTNKPPSIQKHETEQITPSKRSNVIILKSRRKPRENISARINESYNEKMEIQKANISLIEEISSSMNSAESSREDKSKDKRKLLENVNEESNSDIGASSVPNPTQQNISKKINNLESSKVESMKKRRKSVEDIKEKMITEENLLVKLPVGTKQKLTEKMSSVKSSGNDTLEDGQIFIETTPKVNKMEEKPPRDITELKQGTPGELSKSKSLKKETRENFSIKIDKTFHEKKDSKQHLLNKVQKQQKMETLFGSETPPRNKIVPINNVNKQPDNRPRPKAANVIVIRRRRKPVQLSDSPPVIVVDQTCLNKS